MQPQSLVHHQLYSQRRQPDRLCWPVPATSGQLHSVFCGTDARLNQDTLPPPTLRLGARRHYTMRCRWRREGMAGWWWVSVSAVENNRDAFGTRRLIRYRHILLSPFRPAVFFFQSQLPKRVSSPCAEVGEHVTATDKPPMFTTCIQVQPK